MAGRLKCRTPLAAIFLARFLGSCAVASGAGETAADPRLQVSTPTAHMRREQPVQKHELADSMPELELLEEEQEEVSDPAAEKRLQNRRAKQAWVREYLKTNPEIQDASTLEACSTPQQPRAWAEFENDTGIGCEAIQYEGAHNVTPIPDAWGDDCKNWYEARQIHDADPSEWWYWFCEAKPAGQARRRCQASVTVCKR
mmetsp:Transcript_29305/g.51296  ORF Transcript_29305/g.51296 Transcript_29305/m.51296 type:complete len:199 (+) Transcript_29305:90-686(+)